MYCITYNLYSSPDANNSKPKRVHQQKIELYADKPEFTARYTELQCKFAKNLTCHLLERHYITTEQCKWRQPNPATLHILYVYEMDDSYEKNYIHAVFDNEPDVKTYKVAHPFNATSAPFKEYLVCIYDVVVFHSAE